MAKTFTTVFQMGGREDQWQRALAVVTKEEADAQAASIVRGGRPAYVAETALWDNIGLPIGASPRWDYERLTWKR